MTVGYVALGATVVSGVASAYGARKAAKASKKGAELQADAEQAALEYQQEVEKLPLAFRDEAMKELGQEYGFTFDEEGNIISDGSTIEQRAIESPFYTAALEQGEDAIGRSASATGRLRGGATPAQLGFNAQSAFQDAYQNQLQGINAFARTPLNTNAIAGSMAGIGRTLGQGVIAQGQIQQDKYQALGNAVGQGINMYGTYKGFI